MDAAANQDLIALTADIVTAHVSHNNLPAGDLPALIAAVHAALAKIDAPVEPEVAQFTPAVSIRASVKPDYIVCLEDGKKLKMLKRYLRTNYHMSPEDYRTKWGLPKDYPMVAPSYRETRSTLARTIGLGRKKVEPGPVAKKALTKAAKAPAQVAKAAKPVLAPAAPAADAPTKRARAKLKVVAPA